MKASLRALLAGAIDYAGLFPPAKLPLPEALANYSRYRQGEEAWMLGRFICPASRLKEIPEGVTLSCAAIGRGGETPEGFLAELDADLAAIAASHVRVDVLEVKLPPGPGRTTWLVEETGRRLANRELTVYFEAPWMDDQGLMALFAALFQTSFAGYKMRAGGVEASAFPTSSQLALALIHGISCGQPMKATAGLHHPLPRWDDGVKARMHGFVNLFAAAALGRSILFGTDWFGAQEIVRQILDEEDPARFRFDDAGLGWRTYSATLQEIEQARRQSLVSFGSCSFDEPRDDLRALGWL